MNPALPQRRERRRTPSGLAAGLAGLVAALLLAAGPAAAAPLDDLVAFDGRFIPALAATNTDGTDPRAAERARAATARLVAEWPALRARLVVAGAGAPPAARWPAMLAETDRLVAEAGARVRAGRYADAHDTLEHARAGMLDARRTAGLAYLVDRLVEFHEPMEALAARAPAARAGRLDDAGRAEMVRSFAHARALWLAVERAAVDPARLGLSPQRLEQYRRGVADESAALTRLSEALRAGDAASIGAAAESVKSPFARAYTAFGQPPDEAPAPSSPTR